MSNQYLEELSQSQGIDFRAQVPEGTALGTEEIEPGASVKFQKQRSMMRVGKQALPERQPIYDMLRHDVSMVPPTIAQKRMATYPGRFTTIKPAGWDDNQPEPIEDTCEICYTDPERIQEHMSRWGEVERPKFYRESDLRRHYQLSHSMEWEDIESDRRDRERRGEADSMRTLVASLAALVAADRELPPEIAEQLADKPRRKRAE